VGGFPYRCIVLSQIGSAAHPFLKSLYAGGVVELDGYLLVGTKLRIEQSVA